ncbi:MAG: hypothetical protein JNJ54_35485 [Myxococcaceae bacterium]|nr:hypothetical protein [Myxococcaceae bacterium]
MVRPSVQVLLAMSLTLGACDCGQGRVVRANGGGVRVTLVGVEAEAVTLKVELAGPVATSEKSAVIATLPLAVLVDALMPATYVAKVSSVDTNGATLQTVSIPNVMVSTGGITELTVDLSRTPAVRPAEECDGVDNDGDGEIDEALDLAVCVTCRDGGLIVPVDDARCGPIGCEGLDTIEVRGDLGPAGEATCVATRHGNVVNRCAGPMACAAPNGPLCPMGAESVLARKGVCEAMMNCLAGRPVIDRVANGTPCGSNRVCTDGQCVVVDAGVPPFDAGAPDPSGCSDGTREGFVSIATFAEIAGCSGGWATPGITLATVPTCARRSGNTGMNREGNGCSAADLCAPGWHLCRGKDEVAAKANGSCTDAVPAGAANNSLFFAVVQNSTNNTTCDTSTNHNDVFGCGNLGMQLSGAKNCGVLTRALASTQQGTCGFNEAEPNLGPWQCLGNMMSHLAEGTVVTKVGCPNNSCMYDGRAVGNADKGGVLCCRD